MAKCFSVFSRLFSTSPNTNNAFKHITIVGGGLMGSGIAQVSAQAGYDVTIVEANEEAIKKCDANIKNSIQKVAKKLFQNNSTEAEKYISESMGRLKISLDLNETVANTDLVVEAIVENLEAKHRLFSRLDHIAPEHTVFASNTSSLPIKEIAQSTNRKDRFGGLHFFNPVPVMKLLEVIRTDDTSDETYHKLISWGKSIGKTTITCKDTPGFVVNRLLIPYLADAVRMLERGDASAKDIDIAMKLGAGYPMGPFELIDYVGLDTMKFILDGWHRKNPDHPLFAPISLLDKLVSEGKFGKKSGEGFYSYKKSTGNRSFVSHLPYTQTVILKESQNNANSAVASEVPKEPQKTAEAKKLKFEKVEPQEMSSNPTSNFQDSSRMVESKEKLKRLEKLKKLEKYKNSDDFVRAEREKAVAKKLPAFLAKKTPGKVFVENNFLKYKIKNLRSFVKVERDGETFLGSRNYYTW